VTGSRIVGIDLGGTRLRIGVLEVDPKCNLNLAGNVEELPSPRSWEEFTSVLKDHKDQAGVTPEGYGIAIAGSIKKHAEVIKAPSLPWLDGRNVSGELAPCLGMNPKQIVIANDMEAAAYGEKAKGILRKYEWAIFDTISTGWGGALILNGEVVAGEPGHVNLGFSLPYMCGCGNMGCVEALYSGSAMERRILHHLRSQDILFPSDLGDKVWEYFYKELETEEGWAVSLMEEWAEGVGRAWANVLNRIKPIEAIVYMGTTAENLIPKVLPKIRTTMQRICMFPEHKDPERPLPLEQAKERNRSVYGAVIVYQK
jgi:glucokinase